MRTIRERTIETAERKAAEASGTPNEAKYAAKAAKHQAYADEREAGKAAKQDVKDYISEHKHERLGHFQSLHVFGDRIINKPMIGLAETRPLAGVSASVEQAGGRSSRSTLTRSLLLPMAGWQKGQDDRRAWITVDGPDFQWIVNLHDVDLSVNDARKFAARLTGWGRQATPTTLPPAVSDPAPGGSLPAELAQLADLHTMGALSDEEYATAKTRLLG